MLLFSVRVDSSHFNPIKTGCFQFIFKRTTVMEKCYLHGYYLHGYIEMDNANYGKYFVLQMDLIIVWTKFMILWITNGHGNGQKRRNNARTKIIPYTKNG